MTSCLHKLVRVCLAVISLTAFNNCDVKYFTWKYQTIRHFLCSCSCLFTFLLSSQFFDIRLKSTAYFFWPPCVLLYVYNIYYIICIVFSSLPFRCKHVQQYCMFFSEPGVCFIAHKSFCVQMCWCIRTKGSWQWEMSRGMSAIIAISWCGVSRPIPGSLARCAGSEAKWREKPRT